MSATTSGLAVAAFVISILNLLWTVFRVFLDYPRVSVVITKHVRVHLHDMVQQSVTYRFTVTAINTGNAGTTIANVGLYAKDKTVSVQAQTLRDMDATTVSGPDLPADLPAHGSMSWDFDDAAVNPFVEGQPIQGTVSRYRPVRLRALLRLPLNGTRLYKSPYTEMKGSPKTKPRPTSSRG